jgi:hypothetical protein
MITAMSPHRLAVERSRALHVAVGERLRADPTLVEVARVRVRGWLATRSVAGPYARAWDLLLSRPLDELLEALAEDSERMHDLRQVSPFAGVLDPRSRWRIHREVGERLASETR